MHRWSQHDSSGTGIVELSEFYKLLEELPKPLGVDRGARTSDIVHLY